MRVECVLGSITGIKMFPFERHRTLTFAYIVKKCVSKLMLSKVFVMYKFLWVQHTIRDQYSRKKNGLCSRRMVFFIQLQLETLNKVC